MAYQIYYKNPKSTNYQDGKSYKRGVTQFESYDRKNYVSKEKAQQALKDYKRTTPKKYHKGGKFEIRKNKESKSSSEGGSSYFDSGLSFGKSSGGSFSIGSFGGRQRPPRRSEAFSFNSLNTGGGSSRPSIDFSGLNIGGGKSKGKNSPTLSREDAKAAYSNVKMAASHTREGLTNAFGFAKQKFSEAKQGYEQEKIKRKFKSKGLEPY